MKYFRVKLTVSVCSGRDKNFKSGERVVAGDFPLGHLEELIEKGFLEEYTPESAELKADEDAQKAQDAAVEAAEAKAADANKSAELKATAEVPAAEAQDAAVAALAADVVDASNDAKARAAAELAAKKADAAKAEADEDAQTFNGKTCDQIRVPEIKAILDGRGVKYDAKANKSELFTLLIG